MIKRYRCAAEHGCGKASPFADRHRRQIHAIGHIANRIDGSHAGLGIVINLDRAIGLARHTRSLTAKAIAIGVAAHGQHQGFCVHTLAIGQMGGQARIGLLNFCQNGMRHDPNTLAL